MPNIFVDDDSWWKYKDDDNYATCGECINEELRLTLNGERVGDERTTRDMIEELEDADTEPYQCDMCNFQNDAYENIGDE